MREAVCRKKRKGKEQSIRELDWPGAMRQGFVGVGGEQAGREKIDKDLKEVTYLAKGISRKECFKQREYSKEKAQKQDCVCLD